MVAFPGKIDQVRHNPEEYRLRFRLVLDGVTRLVDRKVASNDILQRTWLANGRWLKAPGKFLYWVRQQTERFGWRDELDVPYKDPDGNPESLMRTTANLIDNVLHEATPEQTKIAKGLLNKLVVQALQTIAPLDKAAKDSDKSQATLDRLTQMLKDFNKELVGTKPTSNDLAVIHNEVVDAIADAYGESKSAIKWISGTKIDQAPYIEISSTLRKLLDLSNMVAAKIAKAIGFDAEFERSNGVPVRYVRGFDMDQYGTSESAPMNPIDKLIEQAVESENVTEGDGIGLRSDRILIKDRQHAVSSIGIVGMIDKQPNKSGTYGGEIRVVVTDDENNKIRSIVIQRLIPDTRDNMVAFIQGLKIEVAR